MLPRLTPRGVGSEAESSRCNGISPPAALKFRGERRNEKSIVALPDKNSAGGGDGGALCKWVVFIWAANNVAPSERE
jgi:hypothetical protein